MPEQLPVPLRTHLRPSEWSNEMAGVHIERKGANLFDVIAGHVANPSLF